MAGRRRWIAHERWKVDGYEISLDLLEDGGFLLRVEKGEGWAELDCSGVEHLNGLLSAPDAGDKLEVRPFGLGGVKLLVKGDRLINEFLDWLEALLLQTRRPRRT